MSNNDAPPQHISEQITEFKKQLTSYSKIYSKLPQFIYQNREIQDDMINYIYTSNSKLEGLLREIMEQEINGETFRRIAYYSSQFNSDPNNPPHHRCTCPHCNNNKQDNEEEEEGYYYDDPADEEED